MIAIIPLTQRFGVAGLAASALLSTAGWTVAQAIMMARRGLRVWAPLLLTMLWTAIGLVGSLAVARTF